MKQEKKKKYMVWVGIFVIVTMVGGTIGFSMTGGKKESKIKYGDLTFYKQDSGWSAWIEKQKVSFLYSPPEVENITIPFNIDRNREKVYFVDESNLSTDYSINRFKLILFHFTELRIVDACIEHCSEEQPIVNCQNSTTPIIYFQNSNKTTGSLDGQCLIFEIKSSEDTDKIVDRMTYKLLGVMNG